MDKNAKPVTAVERDQDSLNKHRYRYIGCTIRTLRKEKGWTQKMLAQKAGINHSMISRIEDASPSRRCSLDVLFKIADALEIKLEDLISTNVVSACEESIENNDFDSKGTLCVFGEMKSIEDNSADAEILDIRDNEWYASLQWTDTCRMCQRKNRGVCPDLACAQHHYDEWGDPIPLKLYHADGNKVDAYLEKKRKQKEAERENK